MKVKLFFVILFCLAGKSILACQDTLSAKSSQELLLLFGQLVEKNAKLSYVFGEISYSVSPVPNEPHVLSVRDITENTMRWIDFTNLQVGKNVHFRHTNHKGQFMVLFTKEVARKGVKRKPKRFELYFMADRIKRDKDYKQLQDIMKNLLQNLEEKI